MRTEALSLTVSGDATAATLTVRICSDERLLGVGYMAAGEICKLRHPRCKADMLSLPGAAGTGLEAYLRSEASLPIRLHLIVEDASLDQVPWEVLANANGVPLGLDQRLRIFRQVPSESVKPPYLARGGRLLVISADPCSAAYGKLNGIKSEIDAIRATLSHCDCKNWTLEVHEHANPVSFRKILRDTRPTVLHFIGHCDNRPTGPALVLESDEEGKEKLLYGEELASICSNAGVRFVFLSGCTSAGCDGAMANLLLDKGVSGLVATQSEWTDATAGQFARALYATLAYEGDLAEAVFQARSAIAGTESAWASPVLYLQESEDHQSAGQPSTTRLPTFQSDFVGREQQLEEVEALIKRAALTSLIGIGGMGKTRLAAQIFQRVYQAFEGAAFVECEGLQAGSAVAGQVARSLGLQKHGDADALESVAAAIGNKDFLLVIDNCEHVLDGCARTVSTLISQCPNLRVLCTSRDILGVAGEMLYRVPPMSIPHEAGTSDATPACLENCESVRLFIDRAKRVRPQFCLTGDNQAALRGLVRDLDGIPLALELAAAWVAVLSPQQIHARLAQAIGVASDDSPTPLSKHQTLGAALDTSFALLSTEEQTAVTYFAAFAGTWSLEGSEAVLGRCGIDPRTALSQLNGLIRKSIVLADEVDGEMRYKMLAPVRQYARDRALRLGVLDNAMQAMVSHMSSVAKAIGDGIRSPEQLRWRRAFDSELDNFRAAIAWGLAKRHHPEVVARMLCDLVHLFLMNSQFRECATAFATTLIMLDGADERLLVETTTLGAAMSAFAGDPDGFPMLQSALETARRSGNSSLVIFCLKWTATLFYNEGNLSRAKEMFLECLQLIEDTRDFIQQGYIKLSLGDIALHEGEFELAETYYEAQLERNKFEGDVRGMGLTYCHWGRLRAAMLKEDALQFHLKGIGCLAAACDEYTLGCQLAIASGLLAEKKPKVAAIVQGFGDSLCNRVGAVPDVQEQRLATCARRKTREALGSEYDQLYALGAGYSISDISDLLELNAVTDPTMSETALSLPLERGHYRLRSAVRAHH